MAGGAASLGVPGLSGSLEEGSIFDALVIDPDASGSPLDREPSDTPTQVFSKWLALGDDRNTLEVYVQGTQMLPLP